MQVHDIVFMKMFLNDYFRIRGYVMKMVGTLGWLKSRVVT